jgi:hypothetical protein
MYNEVPDLVIHLLALQNENIHRTLITILMYGCTIKSVNQHILVIVELINSSFGVHEHGLTQDKFEYQRPNPAV